MTPRVKFATSIFPVATNVDDPHGRVVPEVAGKHSTEMGEHRSVGHRSHDISLENGIAIRGARLAENGHSMGTEEKRGTDKNLGHLLDITVLTNTRGSKMETPDAPKMEPESPSKIINDLSKEEPHTFKATGDPVKKGEKTKTPKIDVKRSGTIHCEDPFHTKEEPPKTKESHQTRDTSHPIDNHIE